VARAMAKDPAQRFQTAGALADTATDALRTKPSPGNLPVTAALPTGAGEMSTVPSRPDPWRGRALAAFAIAAVSLVIAGVAIGVAVASGNASTSAVSPTAAALPPAAGGQEAASRTLAAPMNTSTPVPGTTGATTNTTGTIGESVRDGDIEVTVTAARYTDNVELGNDYSGYKPTSAGAGFRWVVVELRVLNDTQGSMSPGCGSGLQTVVLDDRNRRFDRIMQVNELRGNGDACIPAVQPGSSASVTYAYKVPATASINAMAFRADGSTTPVQDGPRVALDLAAPEPGK
jgi:hypothetical protein